MGSRRASQTGGKRGGTASHGVGAWALGVGLLLASASAAAGSDPAAAPEPPSLASSTALAMASILGPLLASFVASRIALRLCRARHASPRSRRRVLIILLSVGALSAATALPLGLWDRLLTGILFVLGGLRAARPAQPGAWRRCDLPVLASVAATLGLLELGARLLLPPPPAFPSAAEATFVVLADRLYGPEEVYCALIDPRNQPAHLEDRLTPLRKERPVILHLGDSMLYWTGVPKEASVPIVLDREATDVAHVSLAAHGTGPEFHWLVARKWLDRIHPSLVVLHICITNDVEELGRPYPCCGDRGLLDYEDGRALPRCLAAGEDSLGTSVRGAIANAPPPYALRVATSVSEFARHLAGMLYGLSERSGPDIAPTMEGQWERYEALVRGLRDELAARGVALVVALMPNRPELEGGEAARTAAAEVRARHGAIGARLGVPLLDAYETFAEASRASGVAPLFVGSGPRDVHMSVLGHRIYADWLKNRLVALDAWPGDRRTSNANPGASP